MESTFILISIAAFNDLEIMKVDATAAYLNTPMNDNVTHKWLMLDKDVASVLMSMDESYWKQFLRKDGKILVILVSTQRWEDLSGTRQNHVWV